MAARPAGRTGFVEWIIHERTRALPSRTPARQLGRPGTRSRVRSMAGAHGLRARPAACHFAHRFGRRQLPPLLPDRSAKRQPDHHGCATGPGRLSPLCQGRRIDGPGGPERAAHSRLGRAAGLHADGRPGDPHHARRPRSGASDGQSGPVPPGGRGTGDVAVRVAPGCAAGIQRGAAGPRACPFPRLVPGTPPQRQGRWNTARDTTWPVQAHRRAQPRRAPGLRAPGLHAAQPDDSRATRRKRVSVCWISRTPCTVRSPTTSPA